MIWNSIASGVNGFENHSHWDSSGWQIIQFEIQLIWDSMDLTFKKWGFEAQKPSFSARLPSKIKLWSSKTRFSARLPAKIKLWSSKRRLFCETSFKYEALKLKNEAFLRGFLGTWHVDQTLGLRNTIRFNDLYWMLEKYCACHEKVEPRHTNSCHCHAKWSLLSKTSVTWTLQPFHRFSVQSLKHRRYKAQNPCACHAKSIVSDPLQIHHACQRFCNPNKLLRLPRILRCGKIPALATQNAIWTSENVPSTWCLNDFDFQTALSPQRGANLVDTLGSRPVPHHLAFRSWLFEPAKPQNSGKTQHFEQFLPAKIPHVAHLCCNASLPSNIDASRPGGNFQYSRKLDS